MWKKKKCKEKVRWKSAKTAISGIFPAFSAGKKFFSKIGLGHVLSIPNTHLCAKNQEKLMMKSVIGQIVSFGPYAQWRAQMTLEGNLEKTKKQNLEKTKKWNLEKTSKNRFFRHISGIFRRKNMFYENRGRPHFRHCHFAISNWAELQYYWYNL